jgi:hypothetical protein
MISLDLTGSPVYPGKPIAADCCRAIHTQRDHLRVRKMSKAGMGVRLLWVIGLAPGEDETVIVRWWG